jgi:hypothetical protein
MRVVAGRHVPRPHRMHLYPANRRQDATHVVPGCAEAKDDTMTQPRHSASTAVTTAMPSTATVDELLHELVVRHFRFYYFGAARQPDAIAAVGRGPLWTDVVVIRSAEHSAAWREPYPRPLADPFKPPAVQWTYVSTAQITLRNVLNLPARVLDAPSYPLPPECAVPESGHRPYTLWIPQSGGR